MLASQHIQKNKKQKKKKQKKNKKTERATKSKNNTRTNALERSVEKKTTAGFKALLQLANFTLSPDATLNTEIHKNSVRIKHIVRRILIFGIILEAKPNFIVELLKTDSYIFDKFGRLSPVI